jgi:hypothetical protein
MRTLLAMASILLACLFGPTVWAQGDLEVDVELVAGPPFRTLPPQVREEATAGEGARPGGSADGASTSGTDTDDATDVVGTDPLEGTAAPTPPATATTPGRSRQPSQSYPPSPSSSGRTSRGETG